MTPTEFYLWLNGYLETLESEGFDECKIKNIREKMEQVKRPSNQERIIFGPSVNQPPQSNYAPQQPTARK